ncbi:fungal specific transcription factor domain family protein [Fusarium sporotrichioides]|uniref:Fungal specific transcription factor domain family protein n=1 Tax=Fusarium sporotrichioides TaxID=5514 RepID=A0A395RJD7_FUSSP|nr:fungal specific transcription factor domain family protein [Fusarium sporotrichioides]
MVKRSTTSYSFDIDRTYQARLVETAGNLITCSQAGKVLAFQVPKSATSLIAVDKNVAAKGMLEPEPAASQRGREAPVCHARRQKYNQDEMQTMKTRAKGRFYSRSGCANCKQRHIKCDESIPACLACVKRNVECPGYRQPVKWSNKYERRAANDSKPRPGLEGFWLTFEEEAAKLQAAIASNTSLSSQSITVPTPSDDYPNIASPGSTASSAEAYHPRSLGLSVLGTDGANNDLETVESPSHTVSSCFCADNGPGSLVDPPCSDLQEIEAKDGRRQNFSYAPIHHLLWPGNHPNSLSSYYFSLICGITSGFDSPENPFRALVADLMSSYPQVFHSVNAMSAAHLYRRDKKRTAVSLEHRTAAISSLASGIQKLTKEKVAEDSSRTLSATLLATFLLGLSSTWHDASSFEPSYMQGARSILQHWISETARLQPVPPPSISSLPSISQHTSFFVGIVAYLESITAFHMDQELSVTDYLLPLCDNFESSGGQPNPLAGITPSLFMYMAKTGCIVRKHYITRSASTNDEQLPTSALLKSARHVQQITLRYRMPPSHRFSETNDILSPLSHFEIMGRVYQLSILLELYRAFPELMQPEQSSTTSSPSAQATEPISYTTQHISQSLLSLAINILALLSQLPDTSRTKTIQFLPLIIAGSTLQYCKDGYIEDNVSNGLNMHQALTPLLTSEAVVSHWRSFVANHRKGLAAG